MSATMKGAFARVQSLFCYDFLLAALPEACKLPNPSDERQSDVTPRQPIRRSKAVLVLALSLAGIYLYANLFVLPNTPFLLSGDQVYFWTDAHRMLFGEMPFKDFFQFTPPGTDVFYFALFKWLGPRIWVTNMVVLALGIALCWVCFSIARQILPRRAALLSALLFLVLVYGRLLNATHHWFSVLLIMGAVRIGMDRMSSLRVCIVGMLLGAASLFTHTQAFAGLLAFVILLLLQRAQDRQTFQFLFQRLALLIMGFGATWLICNLPFLLAVGPRLMWYYEVTFVGRYVVHGKVASLGLPEALTFRRLPAISQYLIVYFLVVTIYPLSLVHCWLRRNDQRYPNRQKIALLTLTGLLLTAEVAISPNWLRVYAVSMPAMVLTIFLLGLWDDRGPYAKRIVAAGVVLLAVFQTWTRHHGSYIVTELPAGRAALSAEAYEKFGWVGEHTKPGEFFFESLVPTMYLPLALRSPAFVEGLGRTSQTRPEFVQRTIHDLDAKSVRYVLWSHHLDSPPSDEVTVDPLPPFREYLRDRYRRVWIFSDHDEIWERR